MSPRAARPHLVFVYGTLKRDGSNHAFLAGQTFVGAARLAPGFALYCLGEYPGLVADAASPDRITGELWAVDSETLARLDQLEGVADGLYARIPAPLAEAPPSLDAAALARIETYLYLRATTGRTRLGDTWRFAP